MNIDGSYDLTVGRNLENKFPWFTIALREIYDLWIGGKAMILLIVDGLMMSVLSFLFATNGELNLIPPQEMMYLTFQIVLAFGLFLGLVVGANTISGERDQESLEMLLLTPVSYRSIVFGKCLTSLTAWPISFVVSIPYLYILKPNNEMFFKLLLWGGILGTILITSFTGLGVLISCISNSNRISLSVSMVFYILFLIPTQLPGAAQTRSIGIFIKRINPIESSNQFLEKILVNNRTLSEMVSWLIAPLIFMVTILVLLFYYVAPNLKLLGRLDA